MIALSGISIPISVSLLLTVFASEFILLFGIFSDQS